MTAHLVRIAVLALAALACARPEPAGVAHRSELRRLGIPASPPATWDTTFTGLRGRYESFAVRLRAADGRAVTGRLLRPAPSAARPGAGRKHPAVLLNDGRELDSRAVEALPEEFGDVVVLSLDYPAEIPYQISVADVVLRPTQLRRAAERVPAAFSLGAAYLAARADVDSARIALAATSFAVPFAVAAAAADQRFRNVALVYGAGDLDRVLAANLTTRPRALRPAVAWLATRPFRELEPEKYIALIAPRPIVMINGLDDPQMPREAVLALYEAAGEPREIVWLRTGHLMPTDTALVRTLVDTALARMPVLRDATP